jgi:hypothetical protein
MPVDLPYDPQKAHDYYLRTRELKGRTAGKVIVNPSMQARAAAAVIAQRRKADLAKKAQHDRAIARAAAIHKQVIQLNARLLQLKDVLSKLEAQAKQRSGIKTPTKATTTAKPTAVAKSNKPLTNKQKKEAHDRYLKEQKTAPKTDTQQIADAKKQIQEMEIKIEKVRMDMRDAARRVAQAAAAKKKQQPSKTTTPAIVRTPVKR